MIYDIYIYKIKKLQIKTHFLKATNISHLLPCFLNIHYVKHI